MRIHAVVSGELAPNRARQSWCCGRLLRSEAAFMHHLSICGLIENIGMSPLGDYPKMVVNLIAVLRRP